MKEMVDSTRLTSPSSPNRRYHNSSPNTRTPTARTIQVEGESAENFSQLVFDTKNKTKLANMAQTQLNIQELSY